MKWLHNLLKGMSLTACLFVFQACYGTPPGYPDDLFEEETPETVVEISGDDSAEAVLPEAELPETVVAD